MFVVGITALVVVGVLTVVVRTTHEGAAPDRAVQTAARTGPGCADSLVVGVDGNGEQPRAAETFGHTVDAVVRRVVARATRSHRSVDVARVPLTTLRPGTILKGRHRPGDPAVRSISLANLRAWRTPIADGVHRALALLGTATTQCPDRPVLLVGYAQGASVVHRVLVLLGDRGGLGGVIGGIVVADPDKVARSAAGRGLGDPAAPRHRTGVFPRLLRPHADLPGATGSYAVWPVCTRSDLVCDPSRVAVHTAVDVSRGYAHDRGLLRTTAVAAWGQLALWPVPYPRRQVATGSVGHPISVQLTLAPRTPPGVVWSDVAGAPAGVTLSSTGLLSGTPQQSGSFTISYRTAGSAPVTTGHAGSVVLTVSPSSASLSAGGQDTCLTSTDQTATCWGRNDFGQIGDGTTARREVPTPVLGTGWSSISTSGSTTCGIKTDGSLWCWGLDNYGQLGSGRGPAVHQPTQVGNGRHWSQVSAAWSHTCAVKQDGSLWCWGQNLRGQLGIGSFDRWHGMPQRVGTATTWRSVTTGGWHSCAVSSSGDAWCWGNNSLGELGDGTVAARNRPTPVAGSASFLGLSAAWSQTCGVSRAGVILCWGYNRQGQLGDGTFTNRTRPTRVQGSQTWTAVSAGDGSTCGVDSAAALWCWGDDRYGQLGDDSADLPTTSPVPVVRLTEPVQLASAGWLHTCVSPLGGAFTCWGNDEAGQLGDGTAQNIGPLPLHTQVRLDRGSLPEKHFLDRASPQQIASRALSARPASRAVPSKRAAVLPFTLMSMNELGSQHTAPSGDSPQFAPGRIRAEWASILYRQRDASLVGTQEPQPDQIDALDTATRHQYRFYPGTTTGYLGAPQSVMWRRADWSLIWKSSLSIPFEKGWRPQPIVQLQQRATGAQVYWINVHFSPGRQQDDRNQAMKILLAAIDKLRPDGLPILLTGDFNESTVAFCNITGHTNLVAFSGGSNTGGTCTPPRPSRVDWIFGSKGTFAHPLIDLSPQARRTTDHAVLSATFGTG